MNVHRVSFALSTYSDSTMTDTTAAHPSQAQQSAQQGRITTGRAIAASTLLLVLFAWFTAAAMQHLWLTSQVPITLEDLQDASWLGIPAITGTYGTPTWAMPVLLLAAGSVLCYFARLPKSFMMPVMLAAIVMLVGGGHASNLRIGILAGTIKIGCFVDTAECRAMLGLPEDDAPARMFKVNTEVPTDEYRAARAKVVPDSKVHLAQFLSLPSASFFVAPLYIGETERLKETVAEQRRELAAMRAAAQQQAEVLIAEKKAAEADAAKARAANGILGGLDEAVIQAIMSQPLTAVGTQPSHK